jgi:hydroxybutyrate-dimer hydrolase
VPLILIHGVDDGLLPEEFSSRAYARSLFDQSHAFTHWRVANAQHFDAFLALPPLALRYVPLLPYAYRALDAMWEHLATGAPLPASAEIAATPRTADAAGIAPLNATNLALPK